MNIKLVQMILSTLVTALLVPTIHAESVNTGAFKMGFEGVKDDADGIFTTIDLNVKFENQNIDQSEKEQKIRTILDHFVAIEFISRYDLSGDHSVNLDIGATALEALPIGSTAGDSRITAVNFGVLHLGADTALTRLQMGSSNVKLRLEGLYSASIGTEPVVSGDAEKSYKDITAKNIFSMPYHHFNLNIVANVDDSFSVTGYLELQHLKQNGFTYKNYNIAKGGRTERADLDANLDVKSQTIGLRLETGSKFDKKARFFIDYSVAKSTQKYHVPSYTVNSPAGVSTSTTTSSDSSGSTTITNTTVLNSTAKQVTGYDKSQEIYDHQIGVGIKYNIYGNL